MTKISVTDKLDRCLLYTYFYIAALIIIIPEYIEYPNNSIGYGPSTLPLRKGVITS